MVVELKKLDKVQIVDPISKKKEKGIVSEVTEQGFFEIAMDSNRTIVVERGEFTRYGLKKLQDQEQIILTDVLMHARNLQNPVSKKKKTSSETWKAFERQVADDFNTKRNALSGMWKGVSGSDTLHRKIYIECKYRDVYAFWDEFRKLEEAALKESPRVTVFTMIDYKKYKGDLWLIDSKAFFPALEFVDTITSNEGAERMIVMANRFNLIKQKQYTGVLSLFKDTEDKAKLEGKIPVVAIAMKNRKGYLLGTNPKYFGALKKIL